jgi:PAS domain S-box-containing protein
MEKIAFLAPKKYMIAQALQIMEEMDEREKKYIDLKLVTSENVLQEAHQSIEQGARVLIARGYQAYLIHKNIDIPLVELTLTGQEISLLLNQAKKMLHKPHPTIAFTGFKNMFSSLEYFDEIFDINIKKYFINSVEDFQQAVNQAVYDKVDLIIGGDTAMACAKKVGICSMFLSSTDISIQESFRTAKSIVYASELEKRNTAQFEILLNYSFNGIIKCDSTGNILLVNHIAEQLLGKTNEQLAGQPVLSYFGEIGQSNLENLLHTGKEIYYTILRVNGADLWVNIAPIKVGNVIDGAILSFQKVKTIEKMGQDVRKSRYFNQDNSLDLFQYVHTHSSKMKDIIRKAKLYALSDAPVLIYGEMGTEKELFAKGIHANSKRSGERYVTIECAAVPQEQQRSYLFGVGAEDSGRGGLGGLVNKANYGTLFVREISELSLTCQYILLNLLLNKILTNGSNENFNPLDIRLIASSTKNLYPLVLEGRFRQDLYYLLSTFSFEIPPLRDRQEDIDEMIDEYVMEFCKRYSKYVVLTKESKKILEEYAWNGNFVQLKNFCELMVVSTKSRMIGMDFVNALLQKAYPVIKPNMADGISYVYKNPEAAVISDLLKKYNGKRELVARELNLSKTTLWRRMKKYGIVNTYEP